MLVKVCGITNFSNLEEMLSGSNPKPDLLGFITYSKSPRYVSIEDVNKLSTIIPESIAKVLVVVNLELVEIEKYFNQSSFSYVQFHGDEDVEKLTQFRSAYPDVKIIKVISINQKIDQVQIDLFQEVCDYFLFDFKGDQLGGNGLKYDWNLLNDLKLKKGFFLSGGVEPSDVQNIIELKKQNQWLIGVDVNSKFEIQAGIKDSEKVISFLREIRGSNEI